MATSHSTSTVLVVAVAAAVLAGAAGFWSGSHLSEPPATRPEAATTEPTHIIEPQPASPLRRLEPRAQDPAKPPAAAGATVPSAAPPPAPAYRPPEALAQENDALRARVAELEQKLDVNQQLRKAEEGEPVPAPTNLAARFDQETLRRNFERSLKEAGFDGAQVTSADCTEFPCILYGEGMGGRDDFEKLNGTAGNQPYKDDRHSTYGWASADKDGTEHRRFGVAMYPSDLPKETLDALHKRMQWRIRQMQQTWAP